MGKLSPYGQIVPASDWRKLKDQRLKTEFDRRHMRLSEILKSARLKAGLSAIDAAAAFGVGKDVIYAWELGRTAPKLGLLLSICEVYRVASLDLIEAAADDFGKPASPITRPAAPASVFSMPARQRPRRIELGGGMKFLCIGCGRPAPQFGSRRAAGGFRCAACVNSRVSTNTHSAKPG